MDVLIQPVKPTISFYNRPQVKVEKIPVGQGVKLGIETVTNPEIGIGGAYGTWGTSRRAYPVRRVWGRDLFRCAGS